MIILCLQNFIKHTKRKREIFFFWTIYRISQSMHCNQNWFVPVRSEKRINKTISMSKFLVQVLYYYISRVLTHTFRNQSEPSQWECVFVWIAKNKRYIERKIERKCWQIKHYTNCWKVKFDSIAIVHTLQYLSFCIVQWFFPFSFCVCISNA